MNGRVTQPWLKRLAWCLVGAAVLFAAATLRVVTEGRSELAASDAAWAAGDALGATVHARAAARAYVPFAAHVQLAYRRLRTVAQECEGRGDVECALFAWRAIRAAAVGSRSFVSAHARQREVADLAIARLEAVSRSLPGANQRNDVEVARAYAPALAADVPPRMSLAALIVAGTALWVAAGVRLTSSGWTQEGRLLMSTARTPLALAAVGLAAWCIALFLV